MNNNSVNIFQNMLNMGKNPKQVEQLLMNKYPQLQVVANQMKQSGLSPIDFVMQYARQNNMHIDTSMVFSMYQQMLKMIK